MEYQVGQILYLCNEKKMSIFPIQVVEEVIRTTLKGKEKTYIVMLPDKQKTQFSIDKVKNDLFMSIDAVRNHMINNATLAINEMSNSAKELEKIAFNIKVELPNQTFLKEVQNKNNVQADINDDIITVDLGDGVKAKINSKNLNKVANQ